MLIHAARRRKTGPNDAETPATIEWTVDAPDYAAGKAEIDAAVADDEVLLYVRPERP